jgi:hypothetical protein
MWGVVSDERPGASPARAPRSVSLPFKTDIPIRSYLDHALPLSIVIHDPKHLDALLSSFTQVFFPDDKQEYDRVLMLPSLRRIEWERLGFLDTLLLDTRTRAFSRPEGLCDALVHHLSQGHYVEAQIDEYFLPGRACHRKAHSVHDNMLVGYDLDARRFLVAGYGADYEIAEVGFDEVVRAFLDVPFMQRKRRLFRMIWRRDGTKGGFDLAGMADQLEDYLGSRATMSPGEMRDARLYWRSRRFTGTWGLDTYSALADYITRQIRERRALDLRATRTLWEHKVCMLARIKFLEAHGYVDRRLSLSQSYAPVERLAKWVRFAAYEYHASERRHSSPAGLVDTLYSMRESETPVLNRLMASLRHRRVDPMSDS